MTKKNFIYAMGNIDPSFIERAAPGEKIPKRKTNAFVRWGSLAACVVLIVCACIPILRWIVLPVPPVYENANYSAFEIGEFFGQMKNGATTSYTKVYAPSKDLIDNIVPVPNDDFLPIYESSKPKQELDIAEFCELTDGMLKRLAMEIGKESPTYEARENRDSISASTKMAEYFISFEQRDYYNNVFIYNNTDDPAEKVGIGGIDVVIDQRQIDEEIIASLECVKEKVFKIFGVEFSDVKIDRDYNNSYKDRGVSGITVYYYNASDHPLNSMMPEPITDNIKISFNNRHDHDGAVVSDSLLTRASISYFKLRGNDASLYPCVGEEKMISLKDAEALLYNGYVFGGHSCRICMAAQDKVSFKGYDRVGIRYIFKYDINGNPTLGIPFYEFYKKIGTAENGNEIYAKTYVPAIEVSGYDEYFESQKQNHK